MAGLLDRASKPAQEPRKKQPVVGMSQTMRSRAEVTTKDGAAIKKCSREESKTMSYEEGSVSQGRDQQKCGHVCEKKVSHAVVVKSESAKSTDLKTIIKDGVKTVMRYENGRLVGQCANDAQLKLPDDMDKDVGKEAQRNLEPSAAVASGPTATWEFPPFPPTSFPTIPPPSFPEVPPSWYPEAPQEFFPEFPSSSFPVVPPTSFPSVPPPSFPSVPPPWFPSALPDMPLESLTAEEKKALKKK